MPGFRPNAGGFADAARRALEADYVVLVGAHSEAPNVGGMRTRSHLDLEVARDVIPAGHQLRLVIEGNRAELVGPSHFAQSLVDMEPRGRALQAMYIPLVGAHGKEFH